MIATILSATPFGYDCSTVLVEGDIKNSLPGIQIIGMGTRSIEEAKDRVRSALTNSGFTVPPKKIVINLSPAELPKEGTQLDLAIAVNILVLSGQLSPLLASDRLFLGELSLDGSVKSVKNIIGLCEAHKGSELKEIFIPSDNYDQASLINDQRIIPVKNLKELVLHLLGVQLIERPSPKETTPAISQSPLILDKIIGQEMAKRAAVIAAAGHHNILLSGPPGVGKTLIAKTLAELLPPLSSAEAKVVTRIRSIADENRGDDIYKRPFRAPHHTASYSAIVGGSRGLKPGEISLAHTGVLFLDELPEYSRNVIESLRQPLEDHTITLSRAGGNSTYPAGFILVATMNPCPCGYFGDETKDCTCTASQIQRYQKKISGPLLDRIDISIKLSRPQNAYASDEKALLKSQHTLSVEQIIYANHKQHERYKCSSLYNGTVPEFSPKSTFLLTNSALSLAKTAATKLQLSPRAYKKILRVSRTIADLDQSTNVQDHHISEALQFSGRF